MLIRLSTGIATSGPVFSEGEVVDWLSQGPDKHAAAKRMISKGLAEAVDKGELAPHQRVKTYTEPPQRPEEKWVIGKGQNPEAPRRPRRPDEAHIEHSGD